MYATINKMSPKTIMEKDPAAFVPKEEKTDEKGKKWNVPKNGESVLLFIIYGIINKIGVKNHAMGSEISMEGNFEAIRGSDGKQFNSGVCYLPENLAMKMAEKFKELGEKSVQFGVKVYLVCNTDTVRGYEYTSTESIEMKGADILESLRKMAKADIPEPAESDPKETGKAGTDAKTTAKPKGK
jgi:hypothetical protein